MIRDVSFSIPEGQVAAFLGPNGAGKSTTIKIRTGYLAPSSGAARIAGLDVNAHRIAAAERLGYVPENGPLCAGMPPPSACSNSSGTPAASPAPTSASVSMPSSRAAPCARRNAD
jgi:energy-coupling factor transporter ATP-binding protein EcfA2